MKLNVFFLNTACVVTSLVMTCAPGWCEASAPKDKPWQRPSQPKEPTELERVFKKREGAVLSAEASIPTIKISKNAFWYDKDQLAEILKATNITKSDHPDNIRQLREIQGGTYSGVIGIVTLDRNALVDPSSPESYVIKEVKWTYEPGKVSKRSDQTPQGELQSMMLVADKVIPAIEEGRKKAPSLPRLAKSRGVFKIYTDPMKRDEHDEVFITIMDLAPGQDLGTYFEQGLEPRANMHKLSEVFADVGKALGAFHRLFADPATLSVLNDPNPDLGQFRTTIHGDLHSRNIYWSENDPVQFIDVATIAQTLNNKVPCTKELSYLFLSTKYTHFLVDNNLAVSKQETVNAMLESIAQGYGEGLAPHNSKAIEKAVVNLLKKWSQDACTGAERLLGKNTRYNYDKPAEVLSATLNTISRLGEEGGMKEMPEKVKGIIGKVQEDPYCQAQNGG